MRLSYLRYRLGQLLSTARRVYRQEGTLAFVNQVWRWLRGERRRGRPASETAPRVISQWGEWAEKQMSATSIKAPSMRFLVFIVGAYGHNHTQASIQAQTDNAQVVVIQGRAAAEAAQIHQQMRFDEAAEWIIFVRTGVVLNPTSLSRIVQHITDTPDADVIYGDYLLITSYLGEKTLYHRPALIGPLILSHNVLEPMAVIRASALRAIGGIRPDVGEGWLWDAALRLIRQGTTWSHLPHLFCEAHDPYEPTIETCHRVITDHLTALGLQNVTMNALDHWKPKWDLPEKHRVSVIIPSRDQPALIRQCLSDLFHHTAYESLEVIVVDTGSTDSETEMVYKTFEDETRLRVIRHTDKLFNFGRACNVGASYATGDLLLFLNNDVQVPVTYTTFNGQEKAHYESHWLLHMARWFVLEQVGIVGIRLRYPGRAYYLQHTGVTVGLHGLAGHATHPQPDSTCEIWLASGTSTRQMLAVTGACLMISRRVFDEVGGWDEGYQLNFSDVQLCLDVHARGYQVIYAAEAILIHHEGQTHKRRVPRADFVRASEKFAEWLEKGDPSYHPAMSYEVPFGFNDDGHTPMDLNRRVMEHLPPDEWIQV